MVLILHVIYKLLREIDSQPAGGALSQGSREVRVGFLRWVKEIDIEIGQGEEHRLVLGSELYGDIVRIGGFVPDGVREQLIDGQVKSTFCVIIDVFLSDELVDEFEDFCK